MTERLARNPPFRGAHRSYCGAGGVPPSAVWPRLFSIVSKSKKRKKLQELIDEGALDDVLTDEVFPMIVDHLVTALRDNPALCDKLAALWLQKAMAGDLGWFKFLVEQTQAVKVPASSN